MFQLDFAKSVLRVYSNAFSFIFRQTLISLVEKQNVFCLIRKVVKYT